MTNYSHDRICIDHPLAVKEVQLGGHSQFPPHYSEMQKLLQGLCLNSQNTSRQTQ